MLGTASLHGQRRSATSPRAKEASRSMRAEIESIVEEIKQSVGLLRRHL
jgi:hypothetical protein